jgi:hypothetical protein
MNFSPLGNSGKPGADRQAMNFSQNERTKFERADNGERRTTQAPQLDTAEQIAEQDYFELLSQLGETQAGLTNDEFFASRRE